MKLHRWMLSAFAMAPIFCVAGPAWADDGPSASGLSNGASSSCAGLPSWSQLHTALQQAVAVETSGLDFNMWGTIVSRDGTVCAVAFSGNQYTDQWLGSRVISAQKANTAMDFSLDNHSPSTVFPNGLALSTANLYSAVQPGGSLFGLQNSNPVDRAGSASPMIRWSAIASAA